MKTYLTLTAIALAATATLSSGVMAAEPAAPTPAFTVTGNFGITSDYRFRGISQNNFNPAFQGGFDVAHSSGLYVGTWGSNVSQWAASTTGNLEHDIYGGYKTELSGVGVDIGAIGYMYPGKTSSYAANTEEVYVGLSYGPAVFKTSYVTSKNYFASTDSPRSARGTLYYDLTLSQELMPKLVGSIHAGYTNYKESATSSSAKVSYSDYNLGLAYDYEGFVFAAKYYWNDAKSGTKTWATSGETGAKLYQDGFALSVTKAF